MCEKILNSGLCGISGDQNSKYQSWEQLLVQMYIISEDGQCVVVKVLIENKYKASPFFCVLFVF